MMDWLGWQAVHISKLNTTAHNAMRLRITFSFPPNKYPIYYKVNPNETQEGGKTQTAVFRRLRLSKIYQGNQARVF